MFDIDDVSDKELVTFFVANKDPWKGKIDQIKIERKIRINYI